MKKNYRYPLIIAHRGASGIFPENTLEACWGAIASNSDIIEVDLQLTKDNKVVLFHDKTVDRIFGNNLSKKAIRDYNLEELQKKNIGSWFDRSFDFCKIVTLEELFNSLPRNTQLILEIKSKEEELILKTTEYLIENKINLGKGYISVRDLESFDKVKSHTGSSYRIGLMQKKRSVEDFTEILLNEKIKIAQIRSENWNDKNLNFLHSLSIETMIFYADTFDKYAQLFDSEVTGILTNFPLRLKTYILKRKRENSVLNS